MIDIDLLPNPIPSLVLARFSRLPSLWFTTHHSIKLTFTVCHLFNVYKPYTSSVSCDANMNLFYAFQMCIKCE